LKERPGKPNQTTGFAAFASSWARFGAMLVALLALGWLASSAWQIGQAQYRSELEKQPLAVGHYHLPPPRIKTTHGATMRRGIVSSRIRSKGASSSRACFRAKSRP
jgi:hypothetical protein